MEPADAAIRVLEERPGVEMHWTVVWDRALRAGYVDPFTQPDVRNQVVRALADLAKAGTIERTSTGTYRFPTLGK